MSSNLDSSDNIACGKESLRLLNYKNVCLFTTHDEPIMEIIVHIDEAHNWNPIIV